MDQVFGNSIVHDWSRKLGKFGKLGRTAPLIMEFLYGLLKSFQTIPSGNIRQIGLRCHRSFHILFVGLHFPRHFDLEIEKKKTHQKFM